LCLARLSAVYRMTLRAIMLIHYWKPARDIHLQLQNFFQKTSSIPCLFVHFQVASRPNGFGSVNFSKR